MNRLNYLTSQVIKCDAEIKAINIEDKSLRGQLADVIRGNANLKEKTAAVIQNRDIEHQSRSSLALTLESLNEKSSLLEEAFNHKATTTKSALMEIQDSLDLGVESLADLLANQGVINMIRITICSDCS